MARYIDADKFKSNLEKAMEKMHLIGGVKGVDVAAVITALDRQPTADVVPKSEVEMLQGALKAEERHNELTMQMAQKALQNAKAELASEIFAELEKYAEPTYMGNGIIKYCFGVGVLAELKKKYTEGEW